MRTNTEVKSAYALPERWVVVDAKDKPLGRVAAQVAHRLRGKHLPQFAPNVDCGDHVIVLNASQVKMTGNKAANKLYWRHSEYPGGIRSETFANLLARKPERVIELAVKGMLPRGPLGNTMRRRLKVYAADQHPHHAQQPQEI